MLTEIPFLAQSGAGNFHEAGKLFEDVVIKESACSARAAPSLARAPSSELTKVTSAICVEDFEILLLSKACFSSSRT